MKGRGGGCLVFAMQNRRPSFIFDNAKQCASARSHWRHNIRAGPISFFLFTLFFFLLLTHPQFLWAELSGITSEWNGAIKRKSFASKEKTIESRMTQDMIYCQLISNLFLLLLCTNLSEANRILLHITLQLYPSGSDHAQHSNLKFHFTH